jgi:molybdate transport system regulatory protein
VKRKIGRVTVKPRLRVQLGAEIAIGPGKADLLEAIANSGSISAAARTLDMSYRRAWLLVDTMNRCFRAPVVAAATGGKGGGGAQITMFGLRLLQSYRRMEAGALKAIEKDVRQLGRDMRQGG